MIPPQKELVYEKVPVADFVVGTIIDIEYDLTHEFKGKDSKVAPAFRFIFKIDGLKFKKRTKWMGLSLDKKSTLYSKYVTSLVEKAEPYMEYDIDRLIGMNVKMLWKFTDPDQKYQAIDSIRPLDGKLLPLKLGSLTDEEATDIRSPFIIKDGDVPF